MLRVIINAATYTFIAVVLTLTVFYFGIILARFFGYLSAEYNFARAKQYTKLKNDFEKSILETNRKDEK